MSDARERLVDELFDITSWRPLSERVVDALDAYLDARGKAAVDSPSVEVCGARRCVCGHDIFRHNEAKELGTVRDCRDCACNRFEWAPPCAESRPCPKHDTPPATPTPAQSSPAEPSHADVPCEEEDRALRQKIIMEIALIYADVEQALVTRSRLSADEFAARRADRILAALRARTQPQEQGEPVEYPVGVCAGCGETVQADHGALGHTRAEHHHACDPDRGCVGECPVPVACGPVHPIALRPPATDPSAAPDRRTT